MVRQCIGTGVQAKMEQRMRAVDCKLTLAAVLKTKDIVLRFILNSAELAPVGKIAIGYRAIVYI